MAEIDLTPTEQMASNAARGLELREKHGKGGTAVGVARARDIKNRKNLSPETVRRMHSFFSRHEGNEAGGEDDAGYISFLLWGGASGRSWAARKSAQLDKKEENAMHSETYKAIASRLGMAARPGAKALMARAQFRVKKLYDGYLMVEINQGSGWEKYETTHEASWDGIEEYEREYQKAYSKGLRWYSGSWHNPSVKASRPGAKSRHAADILKVEVMDGSTVTSSISTSDFMAYAKRSLPGIGSTSSLPDMISRFNELAEEKGMRVRVQSNLAKSRHAVREGDKVSASDDAVSRKIRKLMDEGKPQKQAVAIALDLERRGEL